jgi:Rps23 Pro-64 3,4-dihydroxylase Tpa1-like proline 4-hydroxylase
LYQRSQPEFRVPLKNYGFELLKYSPGQHFRKHCDVIEGHPIYGLRRVSFVALLNTGYRGGELVFDQQGISITPRNGSIIFFPANTSYPHESLDIIEGTKYSVVSWFYAS